MENQAQSPWICHICDCRFRGSESVACSRCFKTTCSAHLRHLPTRDGDSGLYVLQPVCVACATLGDD